jgi:hypothetical protein
MGYASHLNFEKFNPAVCFRVRAVHNKEVLIPSYEIEKQIFVNKHSLDEGSFDVALFINEPKAEFAVRKSEIDKNSLISDVEDLISNYNEAPENLDTEDVEDYTLYNVELSDISVI